jgi:DoxX-like family
MVAEQVFHVCKHFRAFIARRIDFWISRPVIAALTFATAAVWLVFGISFKVLGLVPRHRLIVAAVLGDTAAGPVTVIIGAAETAMALWVLSGVRPRLCAAIQSLAITAMNTLELWLARDLLLAPLSMVCANILFLIVVWYCAIKTPRVRL